MAEWQAVGDPDVCARVPELLAVRPSPSMHQNGLHHRSSGFEMCFATYPSTFWCLN